MWRLCVLALTAVVSHANLLPCKLSVTPQEYACNLPCSIWTTTMTTTLESRQGFRVFSNQSMLIFGDIAVPVNALSFKFDFESSYISNITEFDFKLSFDHDDLSKFRMLHAASNEYVVDLPKVVSGTYTFLLGIQGHGDGSNFLVLSNLDLTFKPVPEDSSNNEKAMKWIVISLIVVASVASLVSIGSIVYFTKFARRNRYTLLDT